MNKVLLCAIAKQENLYIKEWVKYHFELGFDHITIYDNNEPDGEKISDVIGGYPNVNIVDFRGRHQKSCETQVAAYNACYKGAGAYDWVMFMDIDEFLWLKDYTNIKSFLEQSWVKKANVIRFHWKCYSDNGKLNYEELPVMERFTELCKNVEVNHHTKQMYRTKLGTLRIVNVHYTNHVNNIYYPDGKPAPYITTTRDRNVHDEVAHIKHYVTKSLEEYVKIKYARRGVGSSKTRLDLDFYFKYNDKTDEKLKYYKALINELKNDASVGIKGKTIPDKPEDEPIEADEFVPQSYYEDKFCPGAKKLQEVKRTENVIVEKKEEETPIKQEYENYGVSICITAYNAQDFIEECLDSIAAQTWFKTHDNWEIIVGIDGCERTLVKVKEIMHKYKNLRVLMMDSNKGTYVTSNTIMKESKYEWLLRFDSDDKMREYTISCIMENVPQYNFIRFSFENFGSGNCEIKKQYGMSWGVTLFEKNIFYKLGGYRTWRCGGDADFMRRAKSTKCRIYEDQRILFDRRIHKNSLTHDEKTNFNSKLRKSIIAQVKKTDYDVYENCISDFTVNNFTEIKADDGICKNIVNLKNASDKDIEDFLKNRASKSRYNLQINFENPQTIQDKLHWLMVYDKNKMLKSKCADKILLHDYSIRKLGEDICVPIIKVYDNPKDINFDELPPKYVLKCNHGYAMNIICKNNRRNEFVTIKNREIKTREDCINYLNAWLDTNFGDKYYQWHYALIEPKCYSEVFMDDGRETLTDYKVWCCNGEPKMIQVISDRYTKNLHANIYDTNWNWFDLGWSDFKQDYEHLDPKPKQFEKMLDYSRKLSEDFDFVRVDFYVVDDKLYLGELTFSPDGGVFKYKTIETDLYWGNMINITNF